MTTRPLRDHGHCTTWTLSPRIQALAEGILTPTSGLVGLRDLYLSGRALDIMTEVFTTLGGGIHGSRDGLGSADDRRMKRARDYLESHLFDPVTLPDLARKMAMRVSPLQRTFREGMGLSVFENIRQRRLGIAREDLIRGRTSITEVAFRCGYGSSANFATAFKRQFGQSPSAVRRHGSA